MWPILQVWSTPKMKLSFCDRSNELGAICYENQIRKWRNWSYRTTMWPIVEVRSTLKMKLSFHDLLDWVRSMIKTRQDNNVTNCLGALYAENEIELS